MNIVHYEPVCTVYGGAAKQQRRYEQLFHRHRCYAFFLTYPLPLKTGEIIEKCKPH
ncbi:hypothetical protein YPPY89_1411 [Yersinia pestis PY-89]|nr:hypothetical protein YPPY89_1411 [Yersinia pestis PY-89]EIT58844.1 hypothetical protein YPPY102_1270 [Yersinia pestis PY-102]